MTIATAYRITNLVSGADLGVYAAYVGEGAEAAIAAMLADAGCSDAPSSDLAATVVSDAELAAMEMPELPRRRLSSEEDDRAAQLRTLAYAIYDARCRVRASAPRIFAED